MADVVAAGNVHQRFLTGIAARDGFARLVRRQLGRAAEQYATGARTLAAVTGARNDQVPLELGQPTRTVVTGLASSGMLGPSRGM